MSAAGLSIANVSTGTLDDAGKRTGGRAPVSYQSFSQCHQSVRSVSQSSISRLSVSQSVISRSVISQPVIRAHLGRGGGEEEEGAGTIQSDISQPVSQSVRQPLGRTLDAAAEKKAACGSSRFTTARWRPASVMDWKGGEKRMQSQSLSE